MAISSKDLNFSGIKYEIDMATGKGMSITRTVPYRTGESVSFHVFLKSEKDMTLVDVHRKSVERAIEMLQAYLSPEPNPVLSQETPASRPA